MRFSVIVPVFNRPEEVDELLESLTKQTLKTDFEVIIVEDGSETTCEEVCMKYPQLPLHYHYKDNSGPGASRNYGAELASGDFLLILDSDVVLPEGYMLAVSEGLERDECDAFGGPDAAHGSFTPVQKAISYSMTSFFTTGGIRGGKRKMDRFYPRSFNMGVRRNVYKELGGFSEMRFGEDIDFSIRIFKAGYKCRLFPEAWVWHKRRTDFRKFFRQVYNSGIARVNLYRKYPESLKAVHLLPALFAIGVFCCVAGGFFRAWLWSLPAAYALVILGDSTIRAKSLRVGLLSIVAAFVQLMGYGLGFLDAWWKRCVLGKGEFYAFGKTFYK